MRDLASDAQKAVASLLFGAVLPFLVLGLVIAGLFVSCRKIGQMDLEIGYAADTVRIVDSILVAQTETVYVKAKAAKQAKAKSDSLDSLVGIVNDSTVATPSQLLVVPELVVADIRALRVTVATQDTLIRALYRRDTTQEWRIASRDKLYKLSLDKANAPRWGVGATIGYGCSPFACAPTVNVGVTYQAKLPSLRQLLQAVK
jgi:hypothetical protein